MNGLQLVVGLAIAALGGLLALVGFTTQPQMPFIQVGGLVLVVTGGILAFTAIQRTRRQADELRRGR